MRLAGMIGGLGPESTIDYYRSIIARYRARKPDGEIHK
jgi:aspartate/glutamate racemase